MLEQSIPTRPNTFPKKNPFCHDIWSNKFNLSSVDLKVTRVLTEYWFKLNGARLAKRKKFEKFPLPALKEAL